MRNITFLTGYYGSGKSEIAVNLAVQKHIDILVDLDIINPYFRSRELAKELEEFGIESISSDILERASLDMPYISKKIYKPFIDTSKTAIYDLGGNDLGAKLLRQFDDYKHLEVDLLLVVNVFRIETDSADKIIRLINKIEGMGGFKITGLINNSNLLRETVIDNILLGDGILKEVSEKTNLPIVFTTVWDKIDIDNIPLSGEILKMNLYLRKQWL